MSPTSAATIPPRSAANTSSADIDLRAPTTADAPDMWRLAEECLDVNSPYSYLMLAEYFAGTCAVARRHDQLAGFVTGYRLPDDPTTLFIWQIAVAGDHRGHNLASDLLEHVANRPNTPRLRYLEATVTPSNTASARTFRRFARRRDVECVESVLFPDDVFPSPDHEPEHRFRIGPF